MMPDVPGRLRRALSRYVHRSFALLFLLILTCGGTEARAQSATLSGFVTDEADGEPLQGANVVLQQEGASPRGAATGQDGSYVISRIDPGRYEVRISFVGYQPFVDTLDLDADEVRTLNVDLAPVETELGEATVQAEREAGAARVEAGKQTITPREIERLPTPDVSGDLVNYLTTLPGVVSTGDRGGQLFIRGGEPSQNLVLLDGMTIYQPFHLLGFYSAFPSDILRRTDVYAGGYGSQYGGRISSVIDVASRHGNKNRFAGNVSLSPFISSGQVEGPIVPGRVSFLASARRSMLDRGAERLVEQELPFSFYDAFGKVHAELTSKSRLSISGIRTSDRGTLGQTTSETPAQEVRWQNDALGLRYLLLPRVLPVVADLHISYSRLNSELGPQDDPTRASTIESTEARLDAHFPGDDVDVDAGITVRLISLSSGLGGLYQNIELKRVSLDQLANYLQIEFRPSPQLRVQPGVRLQFYHSRFDPYLEPRLRAVWNQGVHQVSGAAGLYHQEIVGLSDRRDAASVFTAWSNIPKVDDDQSDVRAGHVPRAVHAILGYQIRPSSWFEFSVEGYYKSLYNLFVSEWTAFPRFTTRLQPADGRSFGFDVRFEVRRSPFYGFINYGYSNTRYEARQASLELWYGTETLEFRPPHDRRHQVNALASVSLYDFDLSLRWAFGSGLPFSRPIGFDGFVLIDDIVDVTDVPGTRRVIYERPYNGLLPTYHRLDVSLERSFSLGNNVELTAQASVINAYDRSNLFYLDTFTLERSNQLPLIPSFGLEVAFNQ